MPDLNHRAVLAPAWRDRAGFRGINVLEQPAGSLDLAQRAHLAALAGLLRMLHDLVAAFADRYAAFPEQLARADTRELAAARALLDRYGLVDRDAGLAAGQFTDPAHQARYDRLWRLGSTSRRAAFTVVAELIDELAASIDPMLPRLTAPDVRDVYLHLYAAVRRQRVLVQAWRTR